jgi:hypothetical protein
MYFRNAWQTSHILIRIHEALSGLTGVLVESQKRAITLSFSPGSRWVPPSSDVFRIGTLPRLFVLDSSGRNPYPTYGSVCLIRCRCRRLQRVFGFALGEAEFSDIAISLDRFRIC